MGTDDAGTKKSQFPENTWNLFLLCWFVCMAIVIFLPSAIETVPYSEFLSKVRQGSVAEVTIAKDEIKGVYKEGKKAFRTIPMDDPQLVNSLAAQNIKFSAVHEDRFFADLFWGGVWIIGAIFLFQIISLKSGKEGLGVMSVEKNKARTYMENSLKTSFRDVAGVDEAKLELQEIVAFLKEPQRATRLGGHLPKGILLVGPPGTGKTLLARAVAGEAGVPFFSISGSEFVEMFVGVGAARVRDLFNQAQTNAPCIIFIDELDALGRARSLNPNTGHDEKEQTLNQLLVELDGFDPRQGVVLLAASNRPEILDPALLRAGRFDRHVLVDRPDKVGRAQILRVHLQGVTYEPCLDIDELAASTPGFTGADLANLVNEAVLVATRRDAPLVQNDDFTVALERVIGGLEKRNRLLNPVERKIVAYHEMGHALVSMVLPGSDPVQKVSIIPRGIGALGYTIQRPTEDRFLMSSKELENKLTSLLGGRAAELIAFDIASTGAADDLSKATQIARSMVTRYGLTEALGPVSYEAEPSQFLGTYDTSAGMQKHYSEITAREIDCCINKLIKEALDRATAILLEHRKTLETGAKLLLAKEALTREDLLQLLEPNVPQAEATQVISAERSLQPAC